MEVSMRGDIANWKFPGKMVKGMGEAMDLVASTGRIIVAMQHGDKYGASKLLRECTVPLTGYRCVQRIVTELAVVGVQPEGGFLLQEIAPGYTPEDIISATAAPLAVSDQLALIAW
ncbi:CoA-transferase [Mucilaginibacter corticis]|uniref:CoA-transferase n=1 Tax=Mucilaginibacter corticis TaxID=2597670 RepID=UPI001FEC824A|nr:CoA-transferase [Mucilaginibacter corticis]